MQAVIMVAGKSTRTYPLTLTRPKPLLPVLNRPLICYNLDQLVGLVDEVILIVGYRKEMIENKLGSEYHGMKLIYQQQKEQLGTGHAVQQAVSHIRNRFIVMNGDDLFAREDIEKLLPYRYAALAIEVTEPSNFGVIQTNEKGNMINLVEKPGKGIGNLANVGCYIFELEIFSILENTSPSERGEIEITSAVLTVARQQQFKVIPLTGYWLPTGFPWDLLKTQRHFFNDRFEEKINGKVEDGALIHGRIQLGEGSVVHSGAQIFGPVCIGNNCKISSLSYIGPYTTLGHQVKVGVNCVIEQSLLMNGCKIGTGCIIRYSVIGSNVSLGEGCHLISHVPNGKSIKSLVKGKWIDTHLTQLGATLADNVRLSARTSIAPGCKVWPEIQTPISAKIEEDLVQK